MTTTRKPKHKQLKEVPIPDEILERGDWLMRTGNETILQFYLNRVAAGTKPSFAAMLALQQPCGIGLTTAQFLQDQNRHGRTIADRFNNDTHSIERLQKKLAERGYKLRPDDHYIGGAAQFEGDPGAIVNQTRSFKDVEKYVSENQKRKADEPFKVAHKLSPQIINRVRERKIAQNPDLAHADQKELTHQIIEQHGSRKGF